MTTPSPRFEWSEFAEAAPDANAALLDLGKAIRASGLEDELIDLIQLRVSHMNGCDFCIQFHLNRLRQMEVSPLKLNLVVAWRDAACFSVRERAALQWAETLTDLGRDGVPDTDFALIAAHFSREEMAFLTAAVAAINAWNRISIALRFPPPSPVPEHQEIEG